MTLSPETGSELGENGGRGKIQTLHSSSAIVCNFFDYWRAGDLKPLAEALGSAVDRGKAPGATAGLDGEEDDNILGLLHGGKL